MSKKDQRIAAKKRKAEAFLNLISSQEEDSKQFDEVKKMNDSESDSETPQKSAKLSTTDEVEISQRNQAFKIAQESLDKLREANQTAAEKSENELAQIRLMLKEKQKISMEKPKLYLTLDELAYQNGRLFSPDNVAPQLPPLFMLDIQHLILNAVQGNIASFKPRFCRLLRPGKVSEVVVMVMEDVSSTDLLKYPQCFEKLKSQFEMSVEMVSPAQYGSTVIEDLCHVPISLNKMRALRVAKAKRAKLQAMMKPPTFVIRDQSQESVSLYANDKFPRTCLLLNTYQMLHEGYPMPVKQNKKDMYADFVYSNHQYDTVTSHSPMFAVDCEMCLTTSRKHELTRVSVVNEKLETIYDTLVKPYNRIINYLTRWSGITKQLLDPVTTRLDEVQNTLQKILPPNAILCGQSLNSDLLALKMFHPYVIDTSVIYNLSGTASRKPGLRTLSQKFLGQTIQESEEGHCSAEDAKATMELVLHKLSNSMEYGDVSQGGIIYPTFDENGKRIKLEITENENSDSSESDNGSADTPNNIVTGIKFFLNNRDRTIAQRQAFFQREGESVYQNLFKLIRDQKKTAALIADKETVEYFIKNDIVTMVPDSDKTCKSCTQSYVQFHDFVFSNFSTFKQYQGGNEKSEEESQQLLKKMSKRVGKVLKHIKPNAIVIIILPGRIDHEGEHSATCFMKVT